ncbi:MULTISPECIES: DUF1403 family protein [Paracoccaceae]|uniref:DUF1403 family protein n=1 Tax=Paracoccaceae TaxID=31989 RepID=UPI001573BC5B|nr:MULTISPECIES: DUF1403 family protein [Paracoccaceae]MBJ2153551.1 DUF1403 family protein [Paracoccus sp. IB05]NTT88551.1 DUF1403 family protein [Tabrizicola sp. SY72]
MSRALKSPKLAPNPPALPRWVRQGVGRDDVETAMFSAGAVLAALDPIARSDDPVGILWRKRLALSAAAAVCQLEGRREGEAQLRDAFALRKPGDDPGPAGRMLIGWRALGEARALRSTDWPARLPGFFDLPLEPGAEVLRDIGTRFVGRIPPLHFAAEAAREVLALGPTWRGLALWLADALLARALGWDRPVQLLAAHLPRAAFRMEGEAWVAACTVAWGRAAVTACDLHVDLTRRATALRAAHLRRPGKDTAAIIAALLTEDAITAQAGAEASDRAARRLFDRLTSLGLVRELTGRPTFRLYGL